MNNNVCSAVLLGHSFIRRLNDFMKDNPSYYNLRLYENLFDIRCRAQGGLTVFRLIHEGSPVLGDHNTGILVLCTILVYKNIPVLYSSIVPVL